MYHTVKDAPKSLEHLSFELETMAMSLELLEQQRQRLGQNCTEVIFIRCLATCQRNIQEVQQLVDRMNHHLERHARLRGKLYFAFKDPDAEDLLGRLEKAKSSLHMAYTMYQSEVTQNMLALQGRMLVGINRQTQLVARDTETSQGSTALISDSTESTVEDANTSKTGRPLRRIYISISWKCLVTDSVFDLVVVRRRARREGTTYRLRFRLPHWLYSRTWDAAITMSQSKLSMELHSYNVVPFHSAIFYFCDCGDLAAMKKLFNSGKAGILDVRCHDSWSETLLSVSFLPSMRLL